MNKTTFMAKPGQVERKWYVVDATDVPLGRLSAVVALSLIHIYVCQVNVGEEEARQIVCGAPNVRAGIKVMVALPGARIADNYKIKKGKIRGLESLGCLLYTSRCV